MPATGKMPIALTCRCRNSVGAKRRPGCRAGAFVPVLHQESTSWLSAGVAALTGAVAVVCDVVARGSIGLASVVRVVQCQRGGVVDGVELVARGDADNGDDAMMHDQLCETPAFAELSSSKRCASARCGATLAKRQNDASERAEDEGDAECDDDRGASREIERE